jgi:hypothetical protein
MCITLSIKRVFEQDIKYYKRNATIQPQANTDYTDCFSQMVNRSFKRRLISEQSHYAGSGLPILRNA